MSESHDFKSPPAASALARASATRQRRLAIADEFDKRRSADPEDIQAWIGGAIALFGGGRGAEGEALITTALARFPNDLAVMEAAAESPSAHNAGKLHRIG